jgi:hypothetical protein
MFSMFFPLENKDNQLDTEIITKNKSTWWWGWEYRR